jgi:SAM-dependent methyltransferase
MPVLAAIDTPAENSAVDPLTVRFEGWLYAGERHADLASIELWAEGDLLGATRILSQRDDVNRALKLTPDALTGFDLLANAPGLFGRASIRLECHARFRDGSRALGSTRDVKVTSYDHRENHYGVLARAETSDLFHRKDIYTSGPSVSEINPDCLHLIERYLDKPPSKVLDVGCGFGGYGRALIAAGYDWLGVEVKASDCVELARLGLPHRQVDGNSLPFPDQSFDATLCVEVLEHIEQTEPFLREIRRVTRKRFLLSVPNLELIPYLHRHAVVPWHLLEGDHKNFFTRASLHRLLSQHFRNVEVLSYAPIPLRTPEGLPLHNHLFAICEV